MKINTVHPNTNINSNPYLRLKAILVVLIVWGGVSLVHWVPVTQGFMLALITHWILVMIVTILKMCLEKQHSPWIKTEHRGLNTYES
jgi:1,2-diacylglycerol 3-beta-glucosyltransferase